MANANTHSIDLESGSSQYLSAADSASLSITGDLTIECWVNLESQPATDGRMQIVSKWDGGGTTKSYFFSYEDSSGTKRFSFFVSTDGSANTSATINHTLVVSTWTHVVCTYDASAGQIEIYINGKSIGTATGTLATSIHDNASTFGIGSRDLGSTPTEFWDGKIDEVRLWNDIRTSNEVLDNLSVELEGDEIGLAGYWKLNNSLLDETSNNNDLTNNGSATFVTDYGFTTNNEGSLDFEESSGTFLETPDSSALSLTGDLTFEFWMNLESIAVGGSNRIISKLGAAGSRSYQISLASSTTFECTVSSDGTATENVTLTSGTTFSTGTWYHIAVSWDASAREWKLYVNGSLDDTQTNASITSIHDNASAFRIGAQSNATDGATIEKFDGLLNDIRVWSVVRTATEISDNYQNQMFHDALNLEGYWKLNNNYIDSTGNGGIMTPTNSPAFSTDVPFSTTTSYFRPDPSVEDVTVDGRVLRDGGISEAWATIHDNTDGTVAADTDASSTFAQIEAGATTNEYKTMARSIFLFDTSRLPDDDTIDSAQMLLYVATKSDTWAGDMPTADKAIRLGTSNPASNTAVATADYDQITATAQATDIEYADIVASVFNPFTLNATGEGNISKTGITKFGIRLKADADDSEPTWSINKTIQLDCDFADGTNRPVLKVVHSAGTPASIATIVGLSQYQPYPKRIDKIVRY